MSHPESVSSLLAGEDSSHTTAASSISNEDSAFDTNDVAVVGYACRVPGGNNSPSQLWSFLLRKGDAVGDIPPMRWESYKNRQPENPDVLAGTTSKGYFLDRLEDFDATFFGILPREAEQIDPQQRITAEVVWEALEHAGIPPQSLAGSDTAVYMGVNSDDYSRLLLEDLPNIEAWMGVGTAFCGVPNRLSYLLDLCGPSMAIDAACASSLVAIHHGRQALIARETSLVIAGGVNALVGPGLTRVLDMAGALSADGTCRSFDDSATGYGRGEGAGVVILKRLTDAIEAGDRILAVLKGSAVGSDGRTNGIMAPNQEAQEQVARKALREAKCSADTIDYIEAHATSTPVGDPAECKAMANVYGSGSNRLDSGPCYVGSVKSSIGHLEAGAGVLGFIKAVMAVQNGLIPPQANLKKLNTRVDWKQSLLEVPTEPVPWPVSRQSPRAAIASYGYGGTVSHAVIEAVPSNWAYPSRRVFTGPPNRHEGALLLLSAPQVSRARSFAAKLARWLKDFGAEHLEKDVIGSVAYTLGLKRGHHKFRTAIVAESQVEAIKLLTTFAEGQQGENIYSERAMTASESKGTVWVFSGHGAQWNNMGKELVHTEPAFQSVVEEVEPIIQEQMGFSATHALRLGDFDTVDKVQVLTFLMQVGLATILRSKGIHPKAVIGHSLGEIAASVVAGALSLTEGTIVCCIRSRLYLELAGRGSMTVVNMPFDKAAAQLHSRKDIAAAIDASPSSCVVAGDLDAIDKVSAKWKQEGFTTYHVKSDVAFHSPSMQGLVERLRQKLRGVVNARPPHCTLYSTSSSDPRSPQLRGAEYWVDNMVNPVLLTSAIKAAASDGHKLFLEVSSHPIVSHSIRETLLDLQCSDAMVIPTLLRNRPSLKSILFALGKLHCLGESVNLKHTLAGTWLHDLPGTTWEHQPYWRKTAERTKSMHSVSHDVKAHVLLGNEIRLSGSNTVVWQSLLHPGVKPFPGKHPVQGVEIVPAAVLLHTFLRAVPGHTLRNVRLRVPVALDPPRELQVLLEDSQIKISSRLTGSDIDGGEQDSWLVNTTTQHTINKDLTSSRTLQLMSLKDRLSKVLNPSFSIDYLAEVDVLEMAFPWTVLEHLTNDDEMLAKVDSDPHQNLSTNGSSGFLASILDAATSISSTIFYKNPLLRMPSSIAGVSTIPNMSVPRVCYIYARKCSNDDDVVDISLSDEEGLVFCYIEAMRFSGLEGKPAASHSTQDLVHYIAWPPARLSEQPLNFRQVCFIANNSSLLDSYKHHLSRIGVKYRNMTQEESSANHTEDSIVIFIADTTEVSEEIFPTSARSCQKLLTTVKAAVHAPGKPRIFCITQNAMNGSGNSALSQAPLIGLARIIQSEEAGTFAGLIDVEDSTFPMQALKYIQGGDVIKIEDGVARTARLRSLTNTTPPLGLTQDSLHIQSHGTYLIVGGLGALGFEVSTFLAEKGARRLVLVSRRCTPPRSQWASQAADTIVQHILSLEAMGVTVHLLTLDITASNASHLLISALDRLSIPPVLGVVHAAGTLANQTVTEVTTSAFHDVIAPKILGAIALHSAFPPKTLDFMVFFSSCGQLLGFPGQASYASGNAFLDTLASQRRALGDNTTSILWTSWRGLGMAASTRFIDAELHARGITDITRNEAFLAWERISRSQTDHAVVLRSLPLDKDNLLPHPILTDIVKWNTTAVAPLSDLADASRSEPKDGPELELYLTNKITQAVATTLCLSQDDIPPNAVLAEMGLDSVMTVELRVQITKAIKVKVGPTLLWTCPTVSHLVQHFMKEKKG